MTTDERLAALKTKLYVFYTPDQVERWMTWEHPRLGWCRPVDLIAAGDIAKVEAHVEQLESGAYA